jgi:hypothetical protein
MGCSCSLRLRGCTASANRSSSRGFRCGIDALVAANVPVTACLNFALKLGAADQLATRGLQLQAAREAFVRYTLENATVITI